MSARQGFGTEEARQLGQAIGVDWESGPFPDYYTRLERMEQQAQDERRAD